MSRYAQYRFNTGLNWKYREQWLLVCRSG